MLAKAEERKPQTGRGGKKRRHDGGEKRTEGRGGGRGSVHLDALSVGYFRRVGERLGEGFEDDEERGESGSKNIYSKLHCTELH